MFKNEELNPYWILGFVGELKVDFGRDYPPEHNLGLVKFFEDRKKILNSRIKGTWDIDWKDGRAGKFVTLTGPYYDKIGPSADELSKIDDILRKKTIEWCEETVPKFEKLIIEICNDYFNQH